ncbi:hypothetical protein BV25DRAFT_1842461 [Artomyces pyxidatus]|uniref:Uncharacterized protein n=1 Tax=Artomyces pyxidatus TaxID=48021 RepID=A0ACB8SJZ4_9AGAM|nr:hypothetical protein BV25DRAFT_1842461 [Artomyces pyxidatus]
MSEFRQLISALQVAGSPGLSGDRRGVRYFVIYNGRNSTVHDDWAEVLVDLVREVGRCRPVQACFTLAEAISAWKKAVNFSNPEAVETASQETCSPSSLQDETLSYAAAAPLSISSSHAANIQIEQYFDPRPLPVEIYVTRETTVEVSELARELEEANGPDQTDREGCEL